MEPWTLRPNYHGDGWWLGRGRGEVCPQIEVRPYGRFDYETTTADTIRAYRLAQRLVQWLNEQPEDEHARLPTDGE